MADRRMICWLIRYLNEGQGTSITLSLVKIQPSHQLFETTTNQNASHSWVEADVATGGPDLGDVAVHSPSRLEVVQFISYCLAIRCFTLPLGESDAVAAGEGFLLL